MKRWKLPLAIVAVIAFALSACGGPKGFVITGKTLEALEGQFVATTSLYNTLLDDGVIDRAEYDAYKEWGLKFQEEYPKAVDAYAIIADCTIRQVKSPDVDLKCGGAEEVTKVILAFKNQLFAYWVAAQKK